MTTRFLGTISTLAFFLICSAPNVPADPPAKIRAFVSILPQKYFVERVGGNRVDVRVLVGPGRSPATYEPTPRQMVRLSQSQVFFRIGVPFERTLIPKIKSTFKNLRIVDTRWGITLRMMRGNHNHHDHDTKNQQEGIKGKAPHHRRSSEHHHPAGDPDPHTWLDPLLVKIQAGTIRDALTAIDPEGAELYRTNLVRFRNDLDRLNEQISKALAPIRGKECLVFHPAFGYFADRYGLQQVAVETGGSQPSARQLSALIEAAKKAGVKVIFVQPQFDSRNAQTIARAIKGVVVPLDPLAQDYMKNLRDMAAKIRSGLSKQQ